MTSEQGVEIRHILSVSPLLAALPDSLLARLSSSGQLRTTNAKEFLFRQGDEAKSIFVIGLGRCRLVQHTCGGNDVTLDVFTRGDVVGLNAVLREGGFVASCQAVTQGTVAVVPADVFRQVLAQSPALMQRLLKLMALRIATQHDQIRELSSAHAEERLASTLLRLVAKVGVGENDALRPDVPVTRQLLAEMCGLTLHSVSRILSQWHRAGYIFAGRERVTLLSVDYIRAKCLS